MMSSRFETLALIILTVLHLAACQACGPFIAISVQVPDNAQGEIKTVPGATGATDVTLSGQNSTDSDDVSLYVDVLLKGETIVFTAKPSLIGFLDWPNTKKMLNGQCEVHCGAASASFQVTVLLTDADTATPVLSKLSYAATVDENYPLNLPIAGISISASDADQDSQNYEITFSLTGQSQSTFIVTSAQEISDQPHTYSTQLMLKSGLDFSVQKSYQFSVVAEDAGGLRATSDVTITVHDIDNKQPEFTSQFYSASVLDAKAVGVVDVKPENIQATDPDIGGPLKYVLIPIPSEAVWSQYFKLDPNTGVLTLAKAVPKEQTIPEELSFTIQAKETKGPFSCQTTLRIAMTATPGIPDPTSTTGYIVGLAVLGALLVVALIVAAVFFGKSRNNTRRSKPGSDKEALVFDRRTSPSLGKRDNPLAGVAYDNPSMHELEGVLDHRPPEIVLSEPADISEIVHQEPTSHHSPPMRKYADRRPPTPPPTRSRTPSISNTLPPITELESDPSSPSQPISSEGSFFASAEPTPSPSEPTPDYSLKSVGFNNMVECVTIEVAPEPPTEEEEKEEEEMQANIDRAELEEADEEKEGHNKFLKKEEQKDDDAEESAEEAAEGHAEAPVARDTVDSTEDIKKSVEVVLSGDDDESITNM